MLVNFGAKNYDFLVLDAFDFSAPEKCFFRAHIFIRIWKLINWFGWKLLRYWRIDSNRRRRFSSLIRNFNVMKHNSIQFSPIEIKTHFPLLRPSSNCLKCKISLTNRPHSLLMPSQFQKSMPKQNFSFSRLVWVRCTLPCAVSMNFCSAIWFPRVIKNLYFAIFYCVLPLCLCASNSISLTNSHVAFSRLCFFLQFIIGRIMQQKLHWRIRTVAAKCWRFWG